MINLHTRYERQIDEAFTTDSLIRGRLSNKYNFTGVKTIRVSQLQTVPMNDYKRYGTNRFGDPTEMQDIVQEMTLSRERSFSMTIDDGNNQDQQGIKEAARALRAQIRERAVPDMDKYAFAQLAAKAGKIAGNATALSKSNIVDRITEGTEFMNDSEVPHDNRILYVSAKAYRMLRLSDEFIHIDKMGEKSLRKGTVGRFDNMEVVEVPKSRWPENVNFIIVYKNSAILPVKMDKTNTHNNPPHIGGNLLEGRQYYDLFVLAAKANGVYVEVNTAAGAATVLEAPTIDAATGAITAGEGETAYYTVDGSDPRYSMSRTPGASAGVQPAGTVIKAYVEKIDSFPSPVATATVAE